MAKVLIIDDSGYPLDIMKNFLEEQGFTVRIISAEKVIHHHLHDYKPDVILLDIVSENNSRDICKALKTNIDLKRIPVLLMSTDYSKLEKHEECLADDVIKKPFNLSEVMAKINSVMEVYSLRS